MCGQASALGGCGLMEDVAHLLGAVVGDFHTDMRLICREGLTESFLLTLREPITTGSQKIADLGRGGRLCVRGDRSCLAGRGDAPHLERRRRA